MDQQMGDLPTCRVTAAPTFQRVGLDFAGPIMLKSGIRRVTATKGYVCLFVCMVTKAIHLEAVENLSTGAFLAALRRFVSRRGIPEEIYSDNATNFVGAKHELRELYEMFKDETSKQGIFQFCQEKEVTWKMIPPNAPHFGGIWEAGVKSVKSVLKRVYKSASLTITDFYTLLCQIEAMLNSRPLYALSNDPHDLDCLTPAHFTIDRPLIGVAEPSYLDLPENRLDKWQRLQQLRQHFWRRWQKEYLSELQTRHKWTKVKDNIKEGALVLMKEDNMPPQFWKLGRISKVYPGDDGLIRVVDVKTKYGVFKRPIHKLAPLPMQDP
ncbi:uncharacterized protein LOC125767774 isoform X1 [Anopheles funestus]|uniref:uncharacterized protein LOC125767774 isoform X1 n=1 Tax=Anopheles funestus TaxID=62324 RepID=UPI0020C6447C|nr:uncharacterized protein LOC125767774 isoform X1 [Anopheles funestus]